MHAWGGTAFASAGDYTLSGACLFSDVDDLVLNGSHRRYALRVGYEELRRTSFWSVTMYDAKSMQLVDNELDRHLIHSRMVNGMARDEDYGLTIWLQSSTPGVDRETNWLPAPRGPFFMVARMFTPARSNVSVDWSPTVRRR